MKDGERDVNKRSEELKELCMRRDEYEAGLEEKKKEMERLEVDCKELEDTLEMVRQKVSDAMNEYEKQKAKYKSITKTDYMEAPIDSMQLPENNSMISILCNEVLPENHTSSFRPEGKPTRAKNINKGKKEKSGNKDGGCLLF
eukprot:TRINITY_DN791_c0_g1_i9.p2 TRINITY_DN791_c0_g1~~TRINITY_DN791_c0_g1_i9.p2  ORF type:complete len:143 (+),score=54.29 TRINITY_DN791_c0_g1_i9:810-1238(+)